MPVPIVVCNSCTCVVTDNDICTGCSKNMYYCECTTEDPCMRRNDIETALGPDVLRVQKKNE